MAQHRYWVVSLSILIITVVDLMSFQAAAAYSGRGVVNMDGAIIDSACAISAGDREQTIDMGIVPVAEIMRGGHGVTKSFSVQLIHCDPARTNSRLPDWRYFQVTFDGDVDKGLFGVRGDAKGVALEITDSKGNKAQPGKVMPLREIMPGSMKLDYTMRLVSNNQVLKSGGYTSSIMFKMDYY